MTIALLAMTACGSSEPETAELAATSPDTAASADAVSGTWTGDWGPTAEHRNSVTLQLNWDGAKLTGTVNPGEMAIQLTETSFNPETSAIMMKAEAKGHDGAMMHYTIEGKVEGNTMMGTWSHEKQQGDFMATKAS
jgi:hypothetical protein